MTRNPRWTRDELLIALNHYLQNSNSWFDKDSREIKSLAAQIRSVAGNLGLKGDETFRNASSVSMKLLNFRRLDPNHSAGGLPRGSKGEEAVWEDYAGRPIELRRIVSAILSAIEKIQETGNLNSDDLNEAQEGRVLARLHQYRERNYAIVKNKKDSFSRLHGRLFCEVCGFDFAEKYGARGIGFIECHHIVPVSELDSCRATKLSDLVLLCANCHRMVHSARPWLSVDELRDCLHEQNEG